MGEPGPLLGPPVRDHTVKGPLRTNPAHRSGSRKLGEACSSFLGGLGTKSYAILREHLVYTCVHVTPLSWKGDKNISSSFLKKLCYSYLNYPLWLGRTTHYGWISSEYITKVLCAGPQCGGVEVEGPLRGGALWKGVRSPGHPLGRD